MWCEHTITPDDVGNWSIPLGGKRQAIAEVVDVGLVTDALVGRRVWRQGGTIHMESGKEYRARIAAGNVLTLGI